MGQKSPIWSSPDLHDYLSRRSTAKATFDTVQFRCVVLLAGPMPFPKGEINNE